MSYNTKGDSSSSSEQVDLLEAIRALQDTIQYLAAALYAQQPRLNATRALVTVSETTQNTVMRLSEANQNQIVNAVTNPSTSAVFFRTMEPWNFSSMGATTIYDNIKVT